MVMKNNIQLHHADNLEIMKTLSDESIDIICIDPPYLYLKNQKLERVFDELKFFSECKRLLTKNGFIVMFGRGESFYRWNTMLADLSFNFKEEIVWNKQYTTSPLMSISRVHETIAIYCKGDSGINKIKVPYVQARNFNLDSVLNDIQKLKSTYKNFENLVAVESFLKEKILSYEGDYVSSTTITCGKRRINRIVAVANAMENGMNEKTIISETREHYTSIHPTQKPVRLLERLLKLVIPMKNKKIVIADWFSGSNSCCEAVINLQSEFPEIEFEFIATEIDEEYFDAGKERIDNLLNTQTNLFSNAL